MKKNGTTLPGGRVSRQSQRVRGVVATFSVLIKHEFAILKKYLDTMMLKLTEHVEITLFLLYKKNTR